MHYNFRIGRSTASTIIKDVCNAIWVCLSDVAIPKFSKERWIQIANGFETYANFPNCIGALDGKHIIRTKQPPHSGSMYYNYKNYFSTVLFAMCDANYCFTYVEVGSYGKSSDAGIFKNSTLFQKLCDSSLDIPTARSFENSDETYPYVMVGDEAFPLLENLLRPYGGKCLDDVKQTFNHRLSVARKYIECSFGILVNKWRIFHRPIDLHIDFTETVIKAACVLHNFVRTRDGVKFHNDNLEQSNFSHLPAYGNYKGNSKAVSVRDKYASYFTKTKRVVA